MSSQVEQVLVCHPWIPVQNGRSVDFIRGHLLWKCHQALSSFCNSFSCCSHHSNNFRCLRCLNCRSLWKRLVCGTATRVTSQCLAVCLSGLELWPGPHTGSVSECWSCTTMPHFQEAASVFRRRKILHVCLIGSVFTEMTSFAIFYSLKCPNLQPLIWMLWL